jgi:hypothetical protein
MVTPVRILATHMSVAAVFLSAPVASTTRFHELPDNRATLVLRDGTHLSMTLYLNYVDVLHVALAPQQATGEFLVMYSAMKPAAFRQALERAEAKLQAGTRVTTGGQALALIGWKWPGPAQAQAQIQQAAMRAVVAPHDHVEEPQSEVRAEAIATHEVTGLNIHFPPEFLRVLVVSYRPNQVWADPKDGATSIRF